MDEIARVGFWGRLFPQGIGRKFIIAVMVIAGYIAHQITVTIYAFENLEFDAALDVAMVNGEKLGEMAIAAFAFYFILKAATDSNGSRQ
jgi:hypothetical protein